jgi:hypothetical protein
MTATVGGDRLRTQANSLRRSARGVRGVRRSTPLNMKDEWVRPDRMVGG